MIKKIQWNNHPIIGNLELDFTKQDGSIYNTIVIAGENGTGKTTILETLSTFLNLGSIESFKQIQYIVNDEVYSIKPAQEHSDLGFHVRTNEQSGMIVSVNSNKNNRRETIENDLFDIRHYGCMYSKARSGFATHKIQSVTTKQLDMEKYEEDTSEDFTSIKQLLVDIDAQDNADWMEITKNGIGTVFSDFQKESKRYRFEKAFNDFFEKMKFKKIDNNNHQEKRIIFEKNGKEISVDSLSTGEKQIVFRGAHLLKNSNNIEYGVVLIDEPELSMHPKWQKKILKYYRNLFMKNGVQTVQFIFATHSDYVLGEALSDRENVLVVTLNDNNGVIQPQKIIAPTILPTITKAETNFLAFGIVSPDYHIELYGYLQNKENLHTVKACDDYIKASPFYSVARHYMQSSYTMNGHTTYYETLPTYIRNAIDHPDSTRTYSQEQLECSINLLIELCR